MKIQIDKIADNFKTPGTLSQYLPYGNGHINDTFLLKYNHRNSINKYIMQRISSTVFKDPESVMFNITEVTKFIRNKLIQQDCNDITRMVLTLIPIKSGLTHFVDNEGSFWRMYEFIRGGETFDTTDNTKKLYEAAAAFGRFLKQLEDFSVDRIRTTIPNFHNTRFRFTQFLNAFKSDLKKRAGNVKKEIDFLLNTNHFSKVENEIDSHIPLRVTHNDTKINNVILDTKTQKGLAVIDLDTIMPGFSIFDFGDLVRTSICNCMEDQKNLDTVYADPDRFKILADGFLSETGDFLLDSELSNLVNGSIVITLMIGMRFLTDYLNGDIYFKTAYSEHNLDRCRVQLKLADSMIKTEDILNDIIINRVK